MNPTAPAPRLSVVIPLYNETRCLTENLARTLEYLEGRGESFEIVLVNDGSLDETSRLCEEAASRHPQVKALGYSVNRGKGYAVKTGVLAALGDRVLFMDADLAVPLSYIEPCVQALDQGADLVLASRHAQGASIQVPESFVRRFMGEVFRQICKWGLGLKVTDVTCGLKGFTRETGKEIFPRCQVERWSYDAEIILLAQALGKKMAEVPVTWFHSRESAVRVGRDAVESFVDLLKIRWRILFGRYGL
ncbi:MAG: glycosyltransferase family 2 protein [Proteobacteria bacterium]|nr:glycosyltransferase family 2 protein [Pseudomonadota bacterium]